MQAPTGVTAGMARAIAALALALAGFAAQAQDAPQTCRIFQDGEWQDVGSGSATSCLKAVDRWVAEYNSQGFKFGSWAQLMLATDPESFYLSDDLGKSWKTIGLKADLRKATDLAGELAGPSARLAETVAAGPPEGDRRTCSLYAAGGWQMRVDQTLAQCATALEQATPATDAKGYRYGYWSGVFLAAGPDGLVRSENGSEWRPLATPTAAGPR